MTYEEVAQAVEDIRPAIQADGGDLELAEVDVETGVVRVAMLGACVGCHMSQFTLKQGIETYLMGRFPEITSVEALEGEGDPQMSHSYPPPPWL